MNYRKKRINNERFSIRFCSIAEAHGFKSIGKFEDFLSQCNPSVKLYNHMSYERATRLVKELNHFKNIKEVV